MKEKISSSLFQLTIPIFLELFLMTIVGNIDILMVSKYSEKGVGVLGGISQILQTQNIIFTFISIGTGILVAQYIGAKKEDKVSDVIGVSLFLNIIIGIFLGAFYCIFAENILTRIKLNQELIALGLNYLKIVGGICIFQGITVVSSSTLRSFGKVKIPLYINIIINLLNVIGNGMFLFGWLGVPILGITGVGIATVTSRGIGCLLSYFALKKYCDFRISKFIFKKFPLDILKYILQIGVPSGAEHFSWNMAQVVIVSVVNTMGTKVIAAKTYLDVTASFLMMFSIALGHGTAIITGRNIGARKIKEAYLQCIKSVKISLVAVIILLFITYFFRDNILSFFTKDSEVKMIAKGIFWAFFIIETGRVFNIIIINSLHAAGDVKFPMLIGICSMFGVAVTLSYTLGIHFKMGLLGIWLANSADEWIRGIIMLKRWNKLKWINNKFL